jgi:hypothetical protein
MLVRRGIRLRGRISRKGAAGLASAIAPVVVGVVLAYAWNAAGATAQRQIQAARSLPAYVGTAAEQAAAQAWARITPAATAPAVSGSAPGSPAGWPGSRGCAPSRTAHSPRLGYRQPSPRAAGSAPATYTIASGTSAASPGTPAGDPTRQSHVARPGSHEPRLSHAHGSRRHSPASAQPASTPSCSPVAQPSDPVPEPSPRAPRPTAPVPQPSPRALEPSPRVLEQTPPVSLPSGKAGTHLRVSAPVTAWPAPHSAHALLGSSAGERVGSARDMRVADRQARSRRWPPLKRSMPGKSWIPGETRLLK